MLADLCSFVGGGLLFFLVVGSGVAAFAYGWTESKDGRQSPAVKVFIVGTIVFYVIFTCMGCPGGLFHGLGR